MNTKTPTHTLLLVWVCAALGLPACLLEPFTGADVVLEVGAGAFTQGAVANRRGQHYELFALEDDGLISIGKFSIDQELNALSYPDGEKIGVANQTADGLPESGIAFKTQADLSNSTHIILSIEPNGESTLAPNDVIARAELSETAPSVLKGDLVGAVPVIGGGVQDLENSRVAIVLNEDNAGF